MDTKEMWNRWGVVLQVEGPFAAAIPKDPKEIAAMLEHRMPSKLPEDFLPLDQLAEQVIEEVEAEEGKPGWSTFKRNEQGLYYEGRCVRGHIKDCAGQVVSFFPNIRNFRAKFVNKVYVEDREIYLAKKEPDGTETRFIQVMTRQGPRSTIKLIDYVNSPRLEFTLKVLNDGVVGEEILRAVFEYGGTHGMGQERSQGWGRYELVELVLVEAKK